MKPVITSKTNSIVKLAASLSNPRYISKHGQFIIEGKHIVAMAKAYHQIVHLIITPNHINLYYHEKLTVVSEDIMKYISSQKTPEGVLAICPVFAINTSFGQRILYLDKINDPGNMGTILRSAAAFNIETIILAKGSVNPYIGKVVSSSKGAIFLLNILYDDNYLPLLKDKGYQIVAATSDKIATPITSFTFKTPFVLILGNETHGIEGSLLKITDYQVTIPLEDMESLNVAMAAAILLYHSKNSS
jgi:RNA methyltransferase, TrmH family